MRLRGGEDENNVYVLYSDLLFNLLILFTIFVLALVLRLNNGLKNVSAREQSLSESAQRDAAIDRDDARRERDQARLDNLTLAQTNDALQIEAGKSTVLQAERDQARMDAAARAAERDRAKQQATALQREVAAAKAAADRATAALSAKPELDSADRKLAAVAQQLAIAAGANRFTGRTGKTSLCVGMDLSKGASRYVLFDASTFSSAHSTLDGESAEMNKVRTAKLLRTAAMSADRFTEAELKGLFGALQTRATGDGVEEEGQLSFRFSARATCAASGWLEADGSVLVSAAEAHVRRATGSDNFDAYESSLIGRLIELRDEGRPPVEPETVPVLTFAVDGQNHSVVRLGTSSYTLERFRQIVKAFGDGGIILQYAAAAGEVCPEWVVNDILTPVGYTSAVPDPAELKRLRTQVDRLGAR